MFVVVLPKVFVLLALLVGCFLLLMIVLVSGRRKPDAIDMQEIVSQRDAARVESAEDDEEPSSGSPNKPR